MRLSGGHLAHRKQLTDTAWQYSLEPCSFLVATGRVPGITLCIQDNRARCPRVRRQKHLSESPSCWLPEFTHRERQGSQLPDRFQDVFCPCEGYWELQNPSPKVSQNETHSKSSSISINKKTRVGGRSQAPPNSG